MAEDAEFVELVASTPFAQRYYDLCDRFPIHLNLPPCHAEARDIVRALEKLGPISKLRGPGRVFAFRNLRGGEVAFIIQSRSTIELTFAVPFRGEKKHDTFAVLGAAVLTSRPGGVTRSPPYPRPEFYSLEDLTAILTEALALYGILSSLEGEPPSGVELEPPALLATTQLLAQIHAAPDDDAPRLVYADVLAGAGDPHGELIQVQCELARLGFGLAHESHEWFGQALSDLDDAAASRVKRLRARESALLKAHGESWSEKARAYGVAAGIRFARGFVEHLAMDAGAHARDFDALFRDVPTLRSLALFGELEETEDAPLVARCEGLARLSCLATASSLPTGPLAMDVVLSSPHLTSLRRLEHEITGDEGAAVLERAVFASRLEALVSKVQLGPKGLARIVRAMPALVELQLASGDIGPKGAEVLASATQSLRVLGLARNALGDVGGARLLGSPCLAAVRALDLRNNKLRDKTARALGNGLGELRVLDLSNNALGESGARALVSGDGLGALHTLYLQHASLDDAAIEALAESPLLARLHTLSLRSNAVGDRGAEALARSPNVSKLRLLNLNANDIGLRGKRALEASPHLKQARVLV